MSSSKIAPFSAGFVAGGLVVGLAGFVVFGGGAAPAPSSDNPSPEIASPPTGIGTNPSTPPVISPAEQSSETDLATLRARLDISCQTLTAAYPFATPNTGAAAGTEASPGAFAALFGPTGTFAEYEARAPLGAADPAALAFQAARDIRATFQWTLEADLYLPLTIRPFAMHSAIEQAEMKIGSSSVITRQRGNVSAEVTWASGDPISVTFAPAIRGRRGDSSFAGNWALFRFAEANGDGQKDGDTLVRVGMGGRFIVYRFLAQTSDLTATLALLRGFQCPAWTGSDE